MVRLVMENIAKFADLVETGRRLYGLVQRVSQNTTMSGPVTFDDAIACSATMVQKWLSIRASIVWSSYSPQDHADLLTEVNRFNRLLDNINFEVEQSKVSPCWRERLVLAKADLASVLWEIESYLPGSH